MNLLRLQVELEFGLLAGAGVADSHVAELPLAFEFLEAAEREFFEELALRVVRLGLQDAAGFVVDPGEHPGVAVGSGLRGRRWRDSAARGRR